MNNFNSERGLEKALHDIAKKRLENEADQVLSVSFGDEHVSSIELDVKIFGWSVYRVFRDENKNIMSIVLEKDGVFKTFRAEK